MRKSYLLAALAASVVWSGLIVDRVAAQAPVARGAAPTIALVDINYIFKKHARLESAMRELKDDVKAAQADLQRQAEQLKKQAEQLQNFRPGTPDYQKLEEELVRKQNELKTKQQMDMKNFVQREAKLYYNVYQEIAQETQYHCQQNGIAVAINFNGDRINAENPDDIIRGISSRVVYYQKELDITPHILRRIGGGTGGTASGGVAPMGVIPR